MNIKLKAIIYEKFGNQGNFARLLNLSEHRLSRIINEREKPKPEEALKITKNLGLPLSELFDSSEELQEVK